MARTLKHQPRGRPINPTQTPKGGTLIARPVLGRRVDHSEYSCIRWQRVRALVLSVTPTCCRCRVRRASFVDHVLPASQLARELFYKPSQLQGLCRDCHEWKTRALDTLAGIAGNLAREGKRDFRTEREVEALRGLDDVWI